MAAPKQDIALNWVNLGFPDPDASKVWYASDGMLNSSGYKNRQVDQLFKQGASETDFSSVKQFTTSYNKLLPTMQLLSS